MLLRVSQIAGTTLSSPVATFLNCCQGMAGMLWVGLSTQIIWVDVAGCVVLASVSETRDQRKMGELRTRKPKGWEEKGAFLGKWEDQAI